MVCLKFNGGVWFSLKSFQCSVAVVAVFTV